MQHDGVAFHNVAPGPLTREGVLQRVPERVRTTLNPRARERMQRPSGAEIRFVADGEATLTVSCTGGTVTAVPFWGPLQDGPPIVIGREPTAVPFSPPDWLAVGLDPELAGPFPPRVRRLRFHHDADGPVRYHGVEGTVRPPRSDEQPPRRYLAYGTSITEGIASTGPHLAYPAVAARMAGLDPINLGSSASAYCEPTLAEHIAKEVDWDVATLAISVNMLHGGFAPAEFRERAGYLLDTLAATGRPLLAISLFPHPSDLLPTVPNGTWNVDPAPYRTILAELVDGCPDNVSFVAGSDLLADPAGHTVDLLHPGDVGMIEIGRSVGRQLREVATTLDRRDSPR